MKNIKLYRGGLLLSAVFILSGCLFFHRPAFYPAQVLIKNGIPCFSVTDNREARSSPAEISFITVYVVNGEQMSTVWQRFFSLNEPLLKLYPHECLLYGAGEAEATELQKGFYYRVNMNGYIDGINKKYNAYFCLYETLEGKTEIHRAEWSDKMHKRDWGMCNIEN